MANLSPPPVARPNVMNHYRYNRETYDETIGCRLSDTRERFVNADRSEQITMLKKSYTFAVISVQTPLGIHERAFSRLWENGEPETFEEISEALQEVNYYKNKSRYIYETFQKNNMWNGVAEMLKHDNTDRAHDKILREAKGVGTVKAPFTLAMLGFVSKMCIDTNLQNLLNMEEKPTTIVVKKYESLCEQVRDCFPSLRDSVSPFIFQWILFDYVRGTVSTHDVFFEEIGIVE